MVISTDIKTRLVKIQHCKNCLKKKQQLSKSGTEKDFLNIVVKSVYKIKPLSIILCGPENGCFPPKVGSN